MALGTGSQEPWASRARSLPAAAARPTRCEGGVSSAPRRGTSAAVGEALRGARREEPRSRLCGFRGSPIAEHAGQTILASFGGAGMPADACREGNNTKT